MTAAGGPPTVEAERLSALDPRDPRPLGARAAAGPRPGGLGPQVARNPSWMWRLPLADPARKRTVHPSSSHAQPQAGRRIHYFQPTGYGGAYQHLMCVAGLLARAGVDVTVHTGHLPEPVGVEGVRVHRCCWWPWGGRAKTALTRVRIAARIATRTIPHLVRTLGRGDVLHVHGTQASAITLAAIVAGRISGARVVLSPHNTFSRLGVLDGALLRAARLLSHALLVHSAADVDRLRAESENVSYAPLVQVAPRPGAESQRRWRERWDATNGERVVLFAGSIRDDKRLDLLIESARGWPAGWRLAVVGHDRGAWPAAERLARLYGIDMRATIAWVDLDDFCAALAAADVVVAPYERASQSGILAIARQVGSRTVAADVGGLGELASATFPPGDVEALTRTIDAQLESGAEDAAAVDERTTVEAHLRAYSDDAA